MSLLFLSAQNDVLPCPLQFLFLLYNFSKIQSSCFLVNSQWIHCDLLSVMGKNSSHFQNDGKQAQILLYSIVLEPKEAENGRLTFTYLVASIYDSTIFIHITFRASERIKKTVSLGHRYQYFPKQFIRHFVCLKHCHTFLRFGLIINISLKYDSFMCIYFLLV